MGRVTNCSVSFDVAAGSIIYYRWREIAQDDTVVSTPYVEITAAQ
jgi:hypothetical protein